MFYDISDVEITLRGWSRNGTFGTCVPLGSQGERFPDSVQTESRTLYRGVHRDIPCSTLLLLVYSCAALVAEWCTKGTDSGIQGDITGSRDGGLVVYCTRSSASVALHPPRPLVVVYRGVQEDISVCRDAGAHVYVMYLVTYCYMYMISRMTPLTCTSGVVQYSVCTCSSCSGGMCRGCLREAP